VTSVASGLFGLGGCVALLLSFASVSGGDSLRLSLLGIGLIGFACLLELNELRRVVSKGKRK
jgi:hypothetical protein